MKDFYNEALSLLEEADKYNYPLNKKLCETFNIRSDVSSRRFKSYFGCTIREKLYEKFYPSRDSIVNALITSDNVKEMQDKLNLSSTSALWKGLLDKEFGYSTFCNAKANFILKEKIDEYNPTKADNLSILIAQVLGDGYICHERGTLTIEHGYKQLDYLKFKVKLINKAFPNTPGIEKIRKRVHESGYISYYWNSNKTISDSYLSKLVRPRHELVHKMTPLGWLLYFMDDGGLFRETTRGFDTGQTVVYFCTIDDTLKASLIKELETYGYKFLIGKSDIRLSDKAQVASFLSGMIFPFKNIIPLCMEYKYDMKI